MDLAVVGNDGFTLGFRMAGIKKVAKLNELETILSDRGIGIIVIDKKSFDSLPADRQQDLVQSTEPMIVVISDKNEDELRNMVLKSIGVDLLTDEK